MPSSGRSSSEGVAICSSRLATRPLRSRNRRSSTNASCEWTWRARTRSRLRAADGSLARNSRKSSADAIQTLESSSVRTLAVRSISASTPELADELRDVHRRVEHPAPGHRGRADLDPPLDQEVDVVGVVALVAEVRALPELTDPSRRRRAVRPRPSGTPSSSGVASIALRTCCMSSADRGMTRSLADPPRPLVTRTFAGATSRSCRGRRSDATSPAKPGSLAMQLRGASGPACGWPCGCPCGWPYGLLQRLLLHACRRRLGSGLGSCGLGLDLLLRHGAPLPLEAPQGPVDADIIPPVERRERVGGHQPGVPSATSIRVTSDTRSV